MSKNNRYERKRRLFAVVCAAIVAIALLLGIVAPALVQVTSAATKTELEESVKEAQKSKNEAKKQLDKVKNNKANVATEVLSIDSDINQTENDIANTEQAIITAQANLEQKEKELIKAEEECVDYDEEFKTRARLMYENKTTSYIEVLLGASNFSDFLSRVELVKEIVEYDKKMLADMIKEREKVRAAKEAVTLEKQNLEAKKQELLVKQEELSYRLEAKEILLAQLMADEEAYKKAYEQAEADEKKIQAELQKIAEEERRKEEEARKKAEAEKKKYTQNHTGTGEYTWPCPASNRITSQYGYRIHPVYKTKKFHAGIDIGAGYGSNIVAADSGTVVTATYGSGYGKYVVVSHGGGVTTLYAHCSSLLVNVGDKVERGQTIAKVGSTGVSTGNHLHFEVRVNGATADPLLYVN